MLTILYIYIYIYINMVFLSYAVLLSDLEISMNIKDLAKF